MMIGISKVSDDQKADILGRPATKLFNMET